MEMEEKVKRVFNFTDYEIKRMLAVFKKLDKDKSGTVSASELFDLPYFKFNPFRDRNCRPILICARYSFVHFIHIRNDRHLTGSP